LRGGAAQAPIQDSPEQDQTDYPDPILFSFSSGSRNRRKIAIYRDAGTRFFLIHGMLLLIVANQQKYLHLCAFADNTFETIKVLAGSRLVNRSAPRTR
jgi:hypothetical protein